MWPLVRQVGTINEHEARQAALAGAMADDLGYYFTGNEDLKLLTNAMHYARSGEWVAVELQDAASDKDPLMFAFALGQLSHYAADTMGHFYGTNVMAVRLAKNEAVFGWRQSYEQGKPVHTQVEAGFDFISATSRCGPATVVQIANDVREGDGKLEAAANFLRRTFNKLFKPATIELPSSVFLDALLTSYDLFFATADELAALYKFRPEEAGLIRDGWKTIRDKLKSRKREPDEGFVRRWIAAGKNFASSALTDPGRAALLSSFESVDGFYSALLKHVGGAMNALFKPGLKFPNVKLDTGMPSASGLYALADETAEQIVSRGLGGAKIACPPVTEFPDYFPEGEELYKSLRKPIGKVSSVTDVKMALQPVTEAFHRVRGTTSKEQVPKPDFAAITFTLCPPGTNCVVHSQTVFTGDSDLRVRAGEVAYTTQTAVADLWLAGLEATMLGRKTTLADVKLWVDTIAGEYRLDALPKAAQVSMPPNAGGFYPSEYCQ